MALKILRRILIAVAIVVILIGVLYAVNGSLEMFPADEQQEKSILAAVLIIIAGAVVGTVGLLIKPKKR